MQHIYILCVYVLVQAALQAGAFQKHTCQCRTQDGSGRCLVYMCRVQCKQGHSNDAPVTGVLGMDQSNTSCMCVECNASRSGPLMCLSLW